MKGTRLSALDYTLLLLTVGILLLAARAAGELADRFGQPAVLGEIAAGIALGPTALGRFAPDAAATLFPAAGPRVVVLDGLFLLAIVLFMLVAGMEVDLSTVWRQGRAAAAVGIAGTTLPFAFGFVAAWLAPNLLGFDGDSSPYIFALFFATALSISALPVIAKTLMDLGLYYTDLGMIVISAAIVSDVAGWMLFAVILGMMDIESAHAGGIAFTIALVIGFAATMLTVVRWAIHRALPWVQAHTSFPGGVLGLALALALCSAAFTEWAGVHAIFGAFLAGVAIGDSSHLRNHTRTIIRQFVSFFFAPLFFASIGLKVDFAAHFDLGLVLIVIVLACIGKVLACGGAGILAGMPKRESWAVAFALNARGAMEIILGLLALRYGVISERLFVALVVMALVTSVMSGVWIPAVLKRAKRRKIEDFLSAKTYMRELRATDPRGAIRELSESVAQAVGLEPAALSLAASDREFIASTALGNGVAVPHARVAGAKAFCVGVGISPVGIDFNAPDGKPAHVLFLLASPAHDDGAQLEILADVADRFSDPAFYEKVAAAGSYTEFLAVLRTRGN
ncbi:MAG: cation:proton antiporter [Candidatus Hydrogenedentes bacterium]|nr:cation:proton antiporter [Candidatus Hydrogenedentota bacterium]